MGEYKSNTKNINLKYQFRRGMKNLSYLTDHILFQRFNTILDISLKNMEKRLIMLQ